MYSFASAEQMMWRAQLANQPPVPATHEDIVTLLNNPRWISRGLDSAENPFIQEMVTLPTKGVVLVLVSQRLQELATFPDWQAQCDGTFCCTPAAPQFSQLFTLHARHWRQYGQDTRVRSLTILLEHIL